MAPPPNLFYPEMMHFALPLHATREELIELAASWAAAHELYISIERFFPDYLVGAVARGGDLAAAIAEFEPVRRICLRETPFDIVASNHVQHVAMNRESFTIVLEPLSEDGLRATALASKMGDEEKLRWWVGLARESAEGWCARRVGGRSRRAAQVRLRPLVHAAAPTSWRPTACRCSRRTAARRSSSTRPPA